MSHSPAAEACGGFAAMGPVGRKYRSIAARRRRSSTGPQHGAQQQMRAVSRFQRTYVAERTPVSLAAAVN